MRQTRSRRVLSSHLREDPGVSSRIALDALEDLLIFIFVCLCLNSFSTRHFCEFSNTQRMPRPFAEDSCGLKCYYGTTYCHPVFCKKHKQPGVVNGNSMVCDHPDGCLAQPSHTTRSRDKMYCVPHAQMVGGTIPLKNLRPLTTRPMSKRTVAVSRSLIGNSGQQTKVRVILTNVFKYREP